MFLAAMAPLYRLLLINTPPNNQSRVTIYAVSTLLSCSAIHIYLDNITVHGFIFAVMVLSAVLLAIRIVKSKNAGTDASTQASGAGKLEKYEIISRLTGAGAGLFVLAYFFWLIDVGFCRQLDNLRRQVGLPWGLLLELHGWWHVLSGIAAYMVLVVVDLTSDKEDCSCGEDNRNKHWEVTKGQYSWPVGPMICQLQQSK
ncbi:aPHC-domain-containing protein [Lepidopterella palustris CBS 459.81]|uniref:APHC-domain-containing protein n=1 Tax=Lepidopterella palustris CBS 459.81 TaxID=1314670 RepID=A0A8E2JBB8_9PEZI|nr:aPHC-domain-containing protein [Lepidopterella palustris CBS 459.81]